MGNHLSQSKNAPGDDSCLRKYSVNWHQSIMRSGLILGGLIFLLLASDLQAEPGYYLNFAILTIPPKFVAGLPLNERPALLAQVSEHPSDDRLDYKSGFLDWHSDSPEAPHSTAPFCMKVFVGDETDRHPLVFIHIQRWFNHKQQTWRETFVLEKAFGEWRDVTRRVLPKGVDRASYFKLSADSPEVEVAAYTARQRGVLYPYGECRFALRWNGKDFDKVSTKPHSIAPDY